MRKGITDEERKPRWNEMNRRLMNNDACLSIRSEVNPDPVPPPKE